MKEGHFKRQLRRRDVITLSFGAMIGWSWVAVAGDWIARGGTLGAIVAFAIGGFAVALIALTYAELAAAMPQAGGEHVYTERALGHNWSFICAWAIIFAYVGVAAFEAVAISTVAEYFLPGLRGHYLWTVAGRDVYIGPVAVGMAAAIVITTLNIRGVRQAAIFQGIAFLLIIAGGAVLVTGAGLHGSLVNAGPLMVGGGAGIAAVLVMVPTMLMGFDVIPQSAEEIDLPFRDIGRLLMISVVFAILWYVMIIAGVALTLGEGARAGAGIVTAQAAATAWGAPVAGDFLVIAGLGGILTSWNAFVLAGGRAIYALGHAGQLPRALGRLHGRYNTPWLAIALIGVVSVAAPLFGRQTLIWIIDATGLAIVVAYGMVAVSFLVLRVREPDMERPYRVPAGRLVGWGAVIMSLGLATLYMPGSPAALAWPQEWGMLAAWTGLGVLFFIAARR